jgi:transposase
MRPLKRHFPAPALTTLTTMLQQTTEARGFRRAQAVRAVVAGHHLCAVSATFHVANAALRQWVQRFAQEGPPGLRDRPRSGRPPKVTCALEQHLNRLVDQDPLEHGSLQSPWSCRALAPVLTPQSGGQLGRESVRGVLKKMRSAPAVPLDGSTPPRLLSPMALWNSPPWSTGHVEERSSCSMQTKRSCGALPYPGGAGGAAPSASACPYTR